MSANFWFATAKVLHFFELRKNNTKKSPPMSETQVAISKESDNGYSADNNQSITFNR